MSGELTSQDAWAEARRRLTGYQVIAFHKAFELLEGRHDTDMANPDGWEGLLMVLKAFGYRHVWMENLKTERSYQLFVRDPWPGDLEAWAEHGMAAFRRL